jgi:hypothetical protein
MACKVRPDTAKETRLAADLHHTKDQAQRDHRQGARVVAVPERVELLDLNGLS